MNYDYDAEREERLKELYERLNNKEVEQIIKIVEKELKKYGFKLNSFIYDNETFPSKEYLMLSFKRG